MKAFTENQMSFLETQIVEKLRNITEGHSSQDILAHIHVGNSDDKTLKQSRILVDVILRNVRDFNANSVMVHVVPKIVARGSMLKDAHFPFRYECKRRIP